MQMKMFLLMAFVVWGCLSEAQAQEDSGGSSSRRSSRSSSRNSSTGETTDDKERSRSSRSRDRETNSRSSSRSSRRGDDDSKAADDKKAADAKTAGKDSKTVKGKPEASKSGSSGGGQKMVDIKFEMQADPETSILYLETLAEQPTLNVTVTENKKFITRLNLYNPKSTEFSQVDASLKYNPQLIRPVAVDDGMIRSNLVSPARILVDENRGLVSIAADFSQPRTDSFLSILKIQWEALEPVASTPISFINTEKHPSGIFDISGANILHMRTDGTVESSANTGLLDATVSIEPTNGTVELAEKSENPFSAVALATNINSGTAEGGIRLFLKPRKPSVKVSEEFLVDIIYQNPRRADMDTVKLKLRFDPDVLQVVDADEGNWITRGVNIFDGAYHDDLPFDYHRKNAAYNSTGIIVYDNGFGSRTPVPEEGIIATIRFRAVSPSVSTAVTFSTDDETAAAQDTAISFLGFNLIGIPGSRVQAISNAAVGVSRN